MTRKLWKHRGPFHNLSVAISIYRSSGIRAVCRRIFGALFVPKPSLPSLGSVTPTSQQYTPLHFPRPENPAVSIVLDCSGTAESTWRCLRSVHANSDGIDFEIILAGDTAIDSFAPIRQQLIGSGNNKGEQWSAFTFESALDTVHGKNLVLLAANTEVLPGWLAYLTETLSNSHHIGIATSRIISPHGKLLVSDSGNTESDTLSMMEALENPHDPEVAYCRTTEQTHGCSMAVKAGYRTGDLKGGVKFAAGGIDFSTLAIQYKNSGLHVALQPQSTIVSHGKIFAHRKQYKNTAPGRTSRSKSTFTSSRAKKILIVDSVTPKPDHDSGSLRLFQIMCLMTELGCQVTFIPHNMRYESGYTAKLQARGIQCYYHPFAQSVQKFLIAHGADFDIVLLSRVKIARLYLNHVIKNCPDARIVFDTVDLHFLREQRQAELVQDKALQKYARQKKATEISLAESTDLTLVVSPYELELFRQTAPDIRLALLSNIHQTDATEKSFEKRKDMLFIGNFSHPPNCDAMLFFLEDIFPLVQLELPDVRIKIVGGHLPDRLLSYAGDKVIFTGFISDIKTLFNDIRLSVAPLRFGAGVKGKINSSMAFGVPVVSTGIGAEGMELTDGKDALIANSAEEFSRAIVRLYRDPSLWQSLRDAGLINIETHFSVRVARDQLQDILNTLDQTI